MTLSGDMTTRGGVESALVQVNAIASSVKSKLKCSQIVNNTLVTGNLSNGVTQVATAHQGITEERIRCSEIRSPTCKPKSGPVESSVGALPSCEIRRPGKRIW